MLSQKVQQLKSIRTVLMVLHKKLLDAERELYEARHGPIASPNEFLTLALQDEEFDWLRTFSKLIVEIDEAIASKRDPITLEKADALLNLSRETLQPSPIGTPTAQKYYVAIERYSTIAQLHVQIKMVFDR
jgi:hypothetical protein